MLRSISSRLKSTIEIDIEHEMLNGYKRKFKIQTDSQKPFFQFVYQLEKEVFCDQRWQKRAFYNDKTQIRWNELKTLEELKFSILTIKNISTRDQIKEILYKYKTKIASSSLDKNSKIQQRIRNQDIEIAQLLLIRPDTEDPFQKDDILRQQVQFYIKRKFEEDILEDQNQTQQNQIRPNSDNNQNELDVVLNVLSDQLKQGNKQLILMNNNDSIQSIQLAFASNRQKIYEIKLNSDHQQFEELKQIEKEKAFIQNFVSQICKNKQFNQKNVHVLGLEKGSIIVKFIVDGVPINSTDIQQIQALYNQSQIDIQVKPFFHKIGFSVNNFDCSKNEDWTSKSDIEANLNSKKLKYQNNQNFKINNKQITTGPQNNPLHTFHPKGWKAYGLNIEDKYENNHWFHDIVEGAWYMVYGLIQDDNQDNFIDKVAQIHPVSQVFETKVYNKIELAEKNCKMTQKGQNKYKMIFQCRVFPEKLLVGNQPYLFAFHQDINEFRVDQIQYIRAEKILLKRIDEQLSGCCQLI